MAFICWKMRSGKSGARLPFAFDDLGERALKNIERPVRVYAVRNNASNIQSAAGDPKLETILLRPQALPKKPSIVVLPLQNMSGDSNRSILPMVSPKI